MIRVSQIHRTTKTHFTIRRTHLESSVQRMSKAEQNCKQSFHTQSSMCVCAVYTSSTATVTVVCVMSATRASVPRKASFSAVFITFFLYTSYSRYCFQAGGRRRRPNLGQFVFLCVFYLCYLYSLVKMHCGVLFYLVQLLQFCVFLQCFDTVG